MSTHVAPLVNEGPALDPEIFAGLLELVDEDDDSFVVDLFQSYVGSYAECMDGIAQALAAADPDGLRRRATRLKGASANVGASHLASLAEHLQRLGESGRVEPAEECVGAIADEYARVITAVESRLPGFRA